MTPEKVLDQKKPALGVDDGTFTLVVARRDPDGAIRYKTEINGFMEVPVNPKTAPMLELIKKQAPVYIPEGSSTAYVMGGKGRKIACALSSVLSQENAPGRSVFQRTMKEGILSVKDSKQSFNLLATMLRSLVTPLPSDRCPIAFACPGQPINRTNRDAEYHRLVVEKILSEVGDKHPDAFGINEAQAIVWSECEAESYTALALSWGAGMVNVSFSVLGYPAFDFSYAGGGDWIDENAAMHSGTDPIIVNEIKMGSETQPGIDLNQKPTGDDEHIRRAIISHYEILINNVVEGIAKHVKANIQRISDADAPPVVVGGGTSIPNGFIEMLEAKMRKTDFGGFKFSAFRRAENPLYAVARGLLIAAEELKR